MSGSLIFVLDGMLLAYSYVLFVYVLLSWVMHEAVSYTHLTLPTIYSV